MLVKLVFLVILQTALSSVVLSKPGYDVDDYEEMGHHFEEFIKTYNRQYSKEQKKLKFHIFIDNVREINELNKKYPHTTFDINKFADLTKAEKREFLGFRYSADLYGKCSLEVANSTKNSPNEWNWCDKGAVSPVKDQKKCGSCWAFSTVALVESRYWQKKQQLVLSEQQLVDCDKKSGGCEGGLMTLGLTSIMDLGGLETEADYPYEATNDKCRFNKQKAAAKVASCSAYNLTAEDDLKYLLYKEGPLSIAVAADSWLPYKTGIFDSCGAKQLDHGVLLVGYGTENGKDYWLIKNSWGDSWGMQGFIKMKRGVGCCGIGSQPLGVVSAVIG